MVDSYDKFQNQVLFRLIARGFELSEGRDIAQRIRNAIATSSSTLTGVRLRNERYTSMRDFIDVLKDSSFNISDGALQRLVKQFETENAITEVNRFVSLNKNKDEARKELFKYLTTISNKITNKLSVLTKINAQIKVSLAKAKEKIANVSANGIFTKLIQAMALFSGGLGISTILLVERFEALVGFVPLGSFGIGSPTSIQEIEVSHSNKEVKFRAVGSIFLAHQTGGKDSIKITGKLTGEARFFWLGLIWLLTVVSKGEDIEFGPDLVSGIITKLERSLTTPLDKTAKMINQSPSYRKHRTFPVILQHEIITNCYVETFSFEQSIDGKKDTITYDLLLRTYDQPTEFIMDAQNTAYHAKPKSRTNDILRFMLNAIWRTYHQAAEAEIDISSWKVKGYYDVDPADMAFTFLLGLS